jgi:hypothetical protein
MKNTKINNHKGNNKIHELNSFLNFSNAQEFALLLLKVIMKFFEK